MTAAVLPTVAEHGTTAEVRYERELTRMEEGGDYSRWLHRSGPTPQDDTEMVSLLHTGASSSSSSSLSSMSLCAVATARPITQTARPAADSPDSLVKATSQSDGPLQSGNAVGDDTDACERREGKRDDEGDRRVGASRVEEHHLTLATSVALPPASQQPEHAQSSTTTTTTTTQKESKPGTKQASRSVRFNVGSRYKVCDVIGEGAYGVVCSAIHRPTGQKVAIKKIQPFDHQMFALRTLRELKLLRFFQECDVSENIISILDIIKPATYEGFKEVYLIQELMETDLHRVIRTQQLSDDHCQYFTYQILRALKPMHCAEVIHRDLKPGNVLLNANCDLKVCDFGLARSLLTAEEETGYMTEYVATRWYRAPEIMLTFKRYTKAIDVWSVGCILGEMITGRPLFPGRDYHDQLSRILDLLGTPTLEEFYNINSRRARDYIRSMPFKKRQDFGKAFPGATPAALDFLARTLTFDPKKRLTVEECLQHPYLAAYHDPDDEPGAPRLDPEFFHFDMKKNEVTKEELRKEVYDQIMEFQPLLR